MYTFSVMGGVKTECDSAAARSLEGSSITLKALRYFDDLTRKACASIENCSCRDGCPQCIYSSYCSERNELCSKSGALIIFRSILNDPIKTDTIGRTMSDDDAESLDWGDDLDLESIDMNLRDLIE
ncbi:hypothetical protein BC936DRAFT_148911 [Jimgerdemannia flammicorona]|uniref:MrfA-like Zn-binding domain-containing protein n=1 Tax=Jimgerdemannia flammicorona TaxID=994334 RepID=A0A433D216_9FUNG|nr:hypothetical protein BC936DRAFT_148911 [Jimgerdemannia flammicorona]